CLFFSLAVSRTSTLDLGANPPPSRFALPPGGTSPGFRTMTGPAVPGTVVPPWSLTDFSFRGSRISWCRPFLPPPSPVLLSEPPNPARRPTWMSEPTMARTATLSRTCFQLIRRFVFSAMSFSSSYRQPRGSSPNLVDFQPDVTLASLPYSHRMMVQG